MPELAELKLTADFINQVARGKTFHAIRKNPAHKWIDISKDIDYPFTIEAKSRGKELMLELTTSQYVATPENMQVKHLMMTMGMAGHFKWLELGEMEKHAHLLFKTDDGILAFVDVRRFGKWNWGFWNSDRGPDPIQNFQNFKANILANINTRTFKKPICEVMMDQKYFNGIGNYLRAEILYRADANPWMPAKDAIIEYPEILDLCQTVSLEAYKLGGGQLKDWENPFGEVNESWDDFMKCYGNPRMAKREWKGRTMWYDPKWDKLTAWCEYSDLPSPLAYEK